MRKPIAITTACGFSPECGTMTSTIALCDDGTMWAWERGAWVPFAPIPQDEKAQAATHSVPDGTSEVKP